ncbi:MAG: CsbD family protein [Pseudobdellovibrionaceae bacterium]
MTAVNAQIVKGKWKEIKGDVQKAWGKLTDDELEKTKGEFKAISGLIQQKYGAAQDASGKKLTEIFKKFEEQKEHAVSAVKKNLKN